MPNRGDSKNGAPCCKNGAGVAASRAGSFIGFVRRRSRPDIHRRGPRRRSDVARVDDAASQSARTETTVKLAAGFNREHILWRHDSGNVAVWTMNGAQKVADQVVSALGHDWMLT